MRKSRPSTIQKHKKKVRLEGLGLLLALKLTKVVCNSYRVEGPETLQETNAKCSKCGKSVWCNPVMLGAEDKYCIKCAFDWLEEKPEFNI